MSSFFEGYMANAMSQILRVYGVTSVTYIAADGTETDDLAAYLGPVSTQTEDLPDGSRVTTRRRSFCVIRDDQNADFPGVETVQLQGKFEHEGMQWNIEEIRFQNDYQVYGSLTNVRERRKTARGTFRR